MTQPSERPEKCPECGSGHPEIRRCKRCKQTFCTHTYGHCVNDWHSTPSSQPPAEPGELIAVTEYDHVNQTVTVRRPAEPSSTPAVGAEDVVRKIVALREKDRAKDKPDAVGLDYYVYSDTWNWNKLIEVYGQNLSLQAENERLRGENAELRRRLEEK